MMGVKDAIRGNVAGSSAQLYLQGQLDKLFYVKTKEDEERKGLHASAIIASDNKFCYREQVLSLFYKRNKTEADNIPPYLMRIFKEGNCIHEKWQNMFINAGIARGIEDRGYSAIFDLYMTPDAIIELNGKLYVVEIKSCNTFSYKHMTTSHPTGTKQLQLYMHFLCIPRGFVLAEDKNTQEFKVMPAEYDPLVARPIVERLYKINKMKKRYELKNKLPERKCAKIGCKTATDCVMSDACFGICKEKLKKDKKV